MSTVVTVPDAPESEPDFEIADLQIKKIKLSGATQPRQAIDNIVVADYAEEMINGTVFPPITVFFDGKVYWCSDGFHRIAAAIKAGLENIRSKVVQGTRRDALRASFSANADHGLRRTNADKRRSVTRMLEDPTWVRLPDREIARECRVSPPFVRTVRNQLGIDGPSIRLVDQNGTRTPTRVSRKPVLDGPDFAEQPSEAAQETKATVFDRYLAIVKARGNEVRTHVNTEFGPIDIETKEAIFIVAGAMTPQVFRNAFVTLLFQKRKRKEKRAVIVGTTDPSLNPWIREAKHFGIEFHEFNG